MDFGSTILLDLEEISISPALPGYLINARYV